MRYALIVLLFPTSAFGSALSIGPLGIDAVGLQGPGNELLDGSGAKIGQVETLRPADPDVDDAIVSPTVDPAQVWLQQQTPTEDIFGLTGGETPIQINHATAVATVMISSDMTAKGVAPGASLYADGYVSTALTDEVEPLKAIQKVLTIPGGGVRAVNNSWGREFPGGEGASQVSLGVDWMATNYDTLLVFALNPADGREDYDAPGDNFNGITVASAEQIDGAGSWRRVAMGNDVENPYQTYHYEVDLMAPGEVIQTTGIGGFPRVSNGSSAAAPHVTGTVALLSQYANLEIARPGTTWTDAAYHHEVLKAVLLNSADKVAGVQGANRTVLDPNGLRWDDTPASMNAFIPLDQYMGAGALNARRALIQYKAGPYTGGDIENIGWEFGETAGFSTLFRYPLVNNFAGGFVSITLAWDRIVGKFGASETTYGGGDLFVGGGFNELDLFLVPAGSQNLNEAVALSVGIDDTVEHIWGEVPAGDYEIVVYQPTGSDQKFGLAWWMGNAPASIEGDFNGDGKVDGDDLVQWKNGFGATYDGADFLAWQQNYGFGVPTTPTSAAVPEPAACLLALIGLPMQLRRRS